ncbi:hypothetical protein Q6350_03840 [Isoptericola sp. b515]|uniref:hypothetical protein n=1 Tax=Isoptericola sp. b515 TaxID=3064652 RepID=UPI00271423F3|nr:hypothetical protein [Isoptericola sp. b515]MDO8147555.1 hypothetical protein [Isoptericola sp. b515]
MRREQRLAWSEALAGRAFGDTSSSAFLPEDLVAAMPSTAYVDTGLDHDFRFSAVVVSGEFTAVENGRAMDWSTDDGDEVPWDAEADTRTLRTTFEVDRTIDVADQVPAPGPGDSLSVQVVVDGSDDAEAVAQGLLDLGPSVVFLAELPEGDGDWRIALDGALVATVDGSSGVLELPVVAAAGTRGDADDLLGAGTTIDDLDRAAGVAAEVSVAND